MGKYWPDNLPARAKKLEKYTPVYIGNREFGFIGPVHHNFQIQCGGSMQQSSWCFPLIFPPVTLTLQWPALTIVWFPEATAGGANLYPENFGFALARFKCASIFAAAKQGRPQGWNGKAKSSLNSCSKGF